MYSYNWLTGVMFAFARLWPDHVGLAKLQKGVFIRKRIHLFITVETVETVVTLQRQTVGVIFKTQNPQSLTWSLPTEDIFQVHR